MKSELKLIDYIKLNLIKLIINYENCVQNTTKP